MEENPEVTESNPKSSAGYDRPPGTPGKTPLLSSMPLGFTQYDVILFYL